MSDEIKQKRHDWWQNAIKSSLDVIVYGTCRKCGKYRPGFINYQDDTFSCIMCRAEELFPDPTDTQEVRMSEIRNIPDVKDSSGIFKFDAGKKAIIVPISAVEGLEKAWVDYAKETGVAILPYHRCDTSIEDWEELCKTVHHAFEYGLHCNDMTFGEIESDISFALDKFAKVNNLPVHDWDADYEETYGDAENSSED